MYSTGSIDIFGKNVDGTADQGTPRLTFDNSSGDFTVYGSFSAFGSGQSSFGGPVVIGQYFGVNTPPGWDYNEDADLTINGGDLTINSGGNEIFGVDNDGSVTIAGINDYISQTGGRKWLYTANSVLVAQSNVNYFVNAGSNTLIKLPGDALMGDMIRIIDIGGALTHNVSMVVRAADNIKVQGDISNTGTAMLTGIAPSNLAGHNGGELVIQTPRASFGLVYAGPVTPDGGTVDAAPSSVVGWYLMDI